MTKSDGFGDVNPEDLYPPDYGVECEPPPLTVADLESDNSGGLRVVRWKESWLAPKAVQFREEIGAEKLRWFTDHTNAIAQFAAVTKRLEICTSGSDWQDWLNKVERGEGDEIENHNFMALGKDTILAMRLAQDWAYQHQKPLAEFYREIADYLTKYESSSASKAPDAFRLLETFKQFLGDNGHLPTKDEIEVLFSGSKSASDASNRTTFNRLLRKVGLDGLPDRQTSERKSGFGGPRGV
jgi:hypothetical protein